MPLSNIAFLDLAGKVQKTCGNEFCGLLLCFLLFFQGSLTIVKWGKSDFLFEKQAKGAKTFKPHGTADFVDGQFVILKEFNSKFDSLAGQIAMRGCIVNLCEQAMEMKAGNAGFPGDRIQPDRLLEILVNIEFCSNNAIIDFLGDLHSCYPLFSNIGIDFQ
jgi:hypothetical protein